MHVREDVEHLLDRYDTEVAYSFGLLPLLGSEA